MDNQTTYRQFGQCYNGQDWTSFAQLLNEHTVLESFDYFYKLKGVDKIIEYFDMLTHPDNTSPTQAHSGFYVKRSGIMPRLKHCIILCESDTLKAQRIIVFHRRWGRIRSIHGMDPTLHRHTRGLCVPLPDGMSEATTKPKEN